MQEISVLAEDLMTSDQDSKILVRTSRTLHRRLLKQAKSKKQSLNDLCVERLSIPSSLEGSSTAIARQVVAIADHLFKDALRAVVFYGSQARKEATTDSDWDFLVVLDDSIKLTRDLYHTWDDYASSTAVRPIETHFVQYPRSTVVFTGFWCEIALDCIVLFEREFCISSHLIRIRHEIADGIMVRQKVHGQSYWIRKEVA